MGDGYIKNTQLSGKFMDVWDAGEGVAVLRLNRGPMNQFHEPMWREMKDIVERIGRTPSIRALVVSSALDKVFTLGLDVASEIGDLETDEEPSRRAYRIHQHVLDFQSAITSLSLLPIPTLSSLSGLVIGLGIDIATATDIRYCSSSTLFSVAEINLGLAPDIGTLQRLPKVVGNEGWVREVCLTGRRFGSEEAGRVGLVGRIVEGGRKEVEKETVEVARVISGKSPIGVISVKRLLNHARDHTVQEGLEYTAAWNMSMLQSEDVVRSMKAMVAREKGVVEYPDWAGGEMRAKL